MERATVKNKVLINNKTAAPIMEASILNEKAVPIFKLKCFSDYMFLIIMKNSKKKRIVLNGNTGAYNGNINSWKVIYYPLGNPIELTGGKKGESNEAVYPVLLLRYKFPKASNPEDITEIFCSRTDKLYWYVIKHVVDDKKNKHPESFVCNTMHHKTVSEELAKLGLNISFPSDEEVESFISSCS